MTLAKTEQDPEQVYQLLVGDLDPSSEPSGLAARLQNLGYLRPGPADGTDDVELRSAIEEFQYDAEIPVTGEADDTTIAKLVELHGA